MWRYISYLVVGSALLGCVGGGTLDDGHANGGSGGGGTGGTGSTGSLPAPGVCSAPAGKLVPHSSVADLTALIVGDWLHCGGDAFPAEFGVGLRISSDHTWNALVRDAAGVLQPIATGFDGYGTWSAGEATPGQTQFNLHPITGGGAGYFVTVSDSGKMWLDWGGGGLGYVRLSAGDAPGTGGAGGTGGPVTVPGPGDCSAPGGHIVPYSSLADFDRLIQGDWQRCSGNAASTSGLRISPDHTWNTLVADAAGALQPMTGSGSSGTWTALEGSKGPFQFNLLYIGGGGMPSFVSFTDSGQMRMEASPSADYVRLGAGAAP